MDVNKEFFSASDKRVEDAIERGEWDKLDPRTKASHAINQATRRLAAAIDDNVPAGRQKSIAFTELESVQMRANRGVFYDG